jgi:TolA-binding protein
MSPAKRITKKQMKEDRLVTSFFKTSEYIQKNPKPFIIGGTVVAVILVAIFLTLWNTDKENREAIAHLARAQISFDQGLSDDAVVELETVVNDYSGTDSAPSACFKLANIYFQNKNYEKALQYFKIMIEQYPDDKMKLAASAAGAGACYEEMGNRAEAGRYYRMAADLYPENMWAPGYLLEAGRNYGAAGDIESARKAYNMIIEDYKDSREVNSAKSSLSELNI